MYSNYCIIIYTRINSEKKIKTSVLFVITPVQLKLSWIHIQFRITR